MVASASSRRPRASCRSACSATTSTSRGVSVLSSVRISFTRRSSLTERATSRCQPSKRARAAAEAAPEDPTRQLALLDAELHDEGGDPTRWAAVAERVERLAPGNPRGRP